jgi:hypothetical protein
MPLMWLNAHIVSLGELQAEESFRMAEIISVGAGKFNEKGREKVISRWKAALGIKGQSNGRSIRLTGTTKDLELMKGTGIGTRANGPR